MIDKREITPNLLAKLTTLLFTRISIRAVLEMRIPYNEMSAEDIARIMMREKEFSGAQSMDSCVALAHTVISYVAQKTAWQNRKRAECRNKLNVFDLLILTLQDLLIINQNRIECRYEEIESWRMIVRHLGEELPLSLHYAQWDHEHHKSMRSRYDEFSWPYVTAHNNKQLRAVIHRGVSDHHCHLWGSTPYFHVSWVNLMNDLMDSEYRKNLRKLNPPLWSAEEERRRRRGDDSGAVKEHYWEVAQARAAWIRLYLCEKLAGITSFEGENASLVDVQNYENWRMLLLIRDKLQTKLDSYTHLDGSKSDYALSIADLRRSSFSKDYSILIGERWLYYQVFWDYCKPERQRVLTIKDYNLFFVYFLIRLRVRSRMVQSNDIIGFDNFQQIQGRKAYFLGDHKSERALTRLAINEILKKPYVNELEVRISPDVSQIKRLEEVVNSEELEDSVAYYLSEKKKMNNENDIRKRYYYVFHFLKRADPRQEIDASYEKCLTTGRICRHDIERRFFLEQAKIIIRFREQQPHLARRVLGIDAASKEIGCRPEVFGTVYRLLGNHQFCYGGYIEEKQILPALGKTYHVGEDFPDIVNGLRAIDEVISFLSFECGDRLGHAIVLGVNVEDWYEKKQREIFVSIQEYIDDLAWLYHALNHFSIPNVSALKEKIIRDFEYWFRIVYRNSVTDQEIKRLMESARRDWYDHTGEDHGLYQEHACHFDIMDYYRAWTLRGDDPACYIDGYFKKNFGSSLMIPEEDAKICASFPPRYDDRYISEYSLLNYLYQFDDQVRQAGARKIKVDITDDYIRAVKSVQIEMRYRIAKKGIAIETNPTSNVLIGTFRRYEKHPILAFNNRGLQVNNEEERECAQMQVSINTDDSGVFYTDIEMEYALLARSVERIVDENAQQRFKKMDVCTWLDNIRIMGNEQTFRQMGDSI